MPSITLRASEDEKAAWTAMAEAVQLSLSDWMRQRCNLSDGPPVPLEPASAPEILAVQPAAERTTPAQRPTRYRSLCQRCQRIGEPSCTACRKAHGQGHEPALIEPLSPAEAQA